MVVKITVAVAAVVVLYLDDSSPSWQEEVQCQGSSMKQEVHVCVSNQLCLLLQGLP